MARILGICGSIRKDGATEFALMKSLEAAAAFPGIETEMWGLRGKKISPCNHCDRCIREKIMCHIEDDLKSLEEPFLHADGIIIASPVYDMNISAQLAAALSRLRPVYIVHPGKLRNKVGAAIATGGTRHGGQEFALLTIVNFFLMHEMFAFGGLGGCYNGGTIWSKDGKAEGAREDEVGMDTVVRLGQGMAEAVSVSVFGRERWNEYAGEHGIMNSDGSPIRDH